MTSTLRPSIRRVTTIPSLSNSTTTTHSHSHNHQQLRHATLIRRPKRPYTFTQLVMLTDGSAFMHRTTSPSPVYRSNKDINNAPLWNPTSEKLMNVEEDEAAKLSAFRSRFGRNWERESAATATTVAGAGNEKDVSEGSGSRRKEKKEDDGLEGKEIKDDGHGLDLLMDLISGSAKNIPAPKGVSKSKKKK